MTPEQVYAILNKKLNTGGIPEEQIQAAIDLYLDNHPEYIGATPEQAQQIADNAAAVEEINNNIEIIQKKVEFAENASVSFSANVNKGLVFLFKPNVNFNERIIEYTYGHIYVKLYIYPGTVDYNDIVVCTDEKPYVSFYVDDTNRYVYMIVDTIMYLRIFGPIDTTEKSVEEIKQLRELKQNTQTIKNIDKTEINQIKANVDNITGYIGYSDDIIGVEVDFENNKFTRLSAAVGLTGGTDFDKFNMYGGRKRCNVSDNGEITAYYGDDNFVEDGSNGQVMVYQPKFYYKVVPLKLEPINGGKDGYSIRKARWYVSDTPQEGFKLHPAFIERGNENDYILLSAYEGCVYDTDTETYILDDSAGVDFETDKLSSIANAKPASGVNNALTRANSRKIAHNRGKGWEQCYVATVSASQLLMLVEYASFDMQKNIGNGASGKKDDGKTNMAENTGATSTLGNKSGAVNNGNNIQFVSYRGEENFWGNIWTWVDGMNEENPADWNSTNEEGKFTGQHGRLYVANHDFADNKKISPYVDTGICPVYGVGYVSAFGYSEEFDWLFIPTEATGTSALPISDYYWNPNPGWMVAKLGGKWTDGANAGAFDWYLDSTSFSRSPSIGGRLVYIPSKAFESEV